ncbi:MAG: NAD(P)-dependent oxidoreductase [Opitutaceae bacterium]|nr:NAD(P)-dependent oxidoreductase [Opitutaceae bacterium]
MKPTIGFIGLGVMGASMAGHLQEAGYPLRVFNRTQAKADHLVNKGATWCATPGEAARGADFILTIVGFPNDVEAVYLGENGILSSAKQGSILIDLTTSRPDLAIKIAEQASAQGIGALDAPVSGGDAGAKAARLSIMVGGRTEDFQKALPILNVMGAKIVHQGESGAGQYTKMCNQIAIASGMMGVCEAMAYAQKAGLNPTTVLQSIESGAAASWSLSNLMPRALAGDFEPGFFVKHFIKDMKIAIESAEAMQLDLPGLTLAKKLYEKLAASGYENNGTQALFKQYTE